MGKNILSFKPRCLEIPIDFCYDLISGFLGRDFSLYPPNCVLNFTKSIWLNGKAGSSLPKCYVCQLGFFHISSPSTTGEKNVCVCVWYNNPSKPTRSERCFIDGNDTNLLRQASKLRKGFPGAAGLFLVVCDWWLGLSGVRNSKLSYLAKYFVWENITNYTSYTCIVWYCWWKNLAPVDMVNIPLFTRLWKNPRWLFGISEASPVSILLKRSLFYYLELLPLGFEGL